MQEIDHARRELRELAEEHATVWRQLQFVSSLQNRLGEVGTLTLRDAERLGAVGPAARAAGLREDVRTDSPRLSYGGFDAVAAQPAKGDVASRMAQRAVELEQSLALLDESLTSRLLPGRRSLRPTADADRDRCRTCRKPSRTDRLPDRTTTADSCGRCTCAPGRTPTGRCSRTQSPATCCPSSR